jgi:hypothetical protein
VVVHNLSAIPREICLETGVDDEGFAIPEAVRLCLEQWRREYGNTEESTLMFPRHRGSQAQATRQTHAPG